MRKPKRIHYSHVENIINPPCNRNLEKTHTNTSQIRFIKISNKTFHCMKIYFSIETFPKYKHTSNYYFESNTTKLIHTNLQLRATSTKHSATHIKITAEKVCGSEKRKGEACTASELAFSAFVCIVKAIVSNRREICPETRLI